MEAPLSNVLLSHWRRFPLQCATSMQMFNYCVKVALCERAAIKLAAAYSP